MLLAKNTDFCWHAHVFGNVWKATNRVLHARSQWNVAKGRVWYALICVVSMLSAFEELWYPCKCSCCFVVLLITVRYEGILILWHENYEDFCFNAFREKSVRSSYNLITASFPLLPFLTVKILDQSPTSRCAPQEVTEAIPVDSSTKLCSYVGVMTVSRFTEGMFELDSRLVVYVGEFSSIWFKHLDALRVGATVSVLICTRSYYWLCVLLVVTVTHDYGFVLFFLCFWWNESRFRISVCGMWWLKPRAKRQSFCTTPRIHERIRNETKPLDRIERLLVFLMSHLTRTILDSML